MTLQLQYYILYSLDCLYMFSRSLSLKTIFWISISENYVLTFIIQLLIILMVNFLKFYNNELF